MSNTPVLDRLRVMGKHLSPSNDRKLLEEYRGIIEQMAVTAGSSNPYLAGTVAGGVWSENSRPRELIDMIRDRWSMSMQAKRAQQFPSGSYVTQCPAQSVHTNGETVYVFAVPPEGKPEIIEDQACIFPSDALLARLHLMVSHGK